jgi:hypothetical protein
LNIHEDIDIQLPKHLATTWKQQKQNLGLYACDAYDEVQLSQLEMQEIFNPTVNTNLELIVIQLSQTNGIMKTR